MTDTKITLDFGYDYALGCDVAEHNGYRIRAVCDDSPINPFEDHDGHWPIAVYSDRSTTYYPKDITLLRPFGTIGDEMIVHMQVHFAKALGSTVHDLIECYLTDEPVAYSSDANVLRDAFEQALDDMSGTDQLDTAAEIWTLGGIPAVSTQVSGHCQGDWAQVLVVALPETQAEFGNTAPDEADLIGTADLYGWWAWGDVYGYVIERPVAVDEDGDVIEWEEIEEGSCWGYFGPDHSQSGLADAALECVPDEAPTPEVREYA